jgi:hypothetical protein
MQCVINYFIWVILHKFDAPNDSSGCCVKLKRIWVIYTIAVFLNLKKYPSMTKSLIPPISRDLKLKNEKDLDQSLAQKGTSYRGFTSIDQEMEREIAMQWFKPAGKSRFFHGVGFYQNSSK